MMANATPIKWAVGAVIVPILAAVIGGYVSRPPAASERSSELENSPASQFKAPALASQAPPSEAVSPADSTIPTDQAEEKPPTVAVVGSGPAFECNLARLPTERIICGSVEFASLDRQIAEAYRQYRAGLSADAQAVALQEQRNFLRARNRCAGDHGCIADLMRSRHAALNEAISNEIASQSAQRTAEPSVVPPY